LGYSRKWVVGDKLVDRGMITENCKC